MKNKIILFLLLISSPVFSQSISQHTNSLKEKIATLQEINAQRESVIENQSLTIEELREDVKRYDNAFKERLEEIDELGQKVYEQDLKIKKQNKILFIMTIIFIIMIAIKVVVMFLKYKFGIKLPYIINCII